MKTINAEALQVIIRSLIIYTNFSPTEGSMGQLFKEAFPEAPVETDNGCTMGCGTPKKWRPMPGELYWFINDCYRQVLTTNTVVTDKERINAGNCFPTEQSCQEAIEKIKKALAE